ncbi:hypothetical protein K523DRAFT_422204 [Schizophyllum commune Tattone D]|nr:hypothetical protein K523DRAFT_422204 [Schizophyllum commune Tattone D]
MTSYAGETAVALLIEASAPIVNTWSSIAPLLPAILQRAAQCKPGNRLRVGVILYGPSHTPLLLNLFFTAPSAMQEVLRLAYESGPLAKPRPAVTGKDPVAVLDALVAALEMFDTLTTVPNQKPVWKQVLHMAAVQPDDARHSTTCVRPDLDGMGWEGLVQAFKDRDINYSTVRCGKRPLGALAEFQKKLATDTIKPWLSYDSSILTLHISASLTAPARPHPVPTTSNKRPAESALPDPKRVRMGAPESPQKASVSPVKPTQRFITIEFCFSFNVRTQLLRHEPAATILHTVRSPGVHGSAIVYCSVDYCAESYAGSDAFDSIEYERQFTKSILDAYALECDTHAIECDTHAIECDTHAIECDTIYGERESTECEPDALQSRQHAFQQPH